MSSCYTCTIVSTESTKGQQGVTLVQLSARCQQIVSKVLKAVSKVLHLYNCQQGVTKLSARCYKLSARCKICNHLSMKNMQVIFSVFVCICVCFCNFLDGGTRSKKKYVMKFYEFYELMIFFYELMIS